ncbi:MAG: hypothetical protein ACI8PD_002296 [Nitrospinales bacterium]|jgi:hypothetical protein
MTSFSSSILIVEQDSGIPGILDAAVGNGEIEMVHVDSPVKGLELLYEKRDPFSIIWSAEQFQKSKFNGMDFLKFCNKHSPTSSRILNSNTLPNTELLSLVQSGELHSYFNRNPEVSFVDGMLSAIDIGIEYHKVNLLGEFIDVTNFTLEDQIAANASALNNIVEKYRNGLRAPLKMMM